MSPDLRPWLSARVIVGTWPSLRDAVIWSLRPSAEASALDPSPSIGCTAIRAGPSEFESVAHHQPPSETPAITASPPATAALFGRKRLRPTTRRRADGSSAAGSID